MTFHWMELRTWTIFLCLSGSGILPALTWALAVNVPPTSRRPGRVIVASAVIREESNQMDRQSVDVAGVSAGAPARLSTWPTQRLAGWTAHLSRLQMFVGLTSGLVSITGALYTVPTFFKAAPRTGEIVAIVRDARTEKAVTDAKVEILTVQNAVITTVIPNDLGKARYSLAEGQYRIRVSHPRFGAEARQVQVLKGHTAEVHVELRRVTSASMNPAESSVKNAIRTVRQLFNP